MKYKKGLREKDAEKAFYLDKKQEKRLRDAIEKAFDQPGDDFSIDEINAFVAPYVKNEQEAFFAGQMIAIMVCMMANESGEMPKIKLFNPNVN